MHTYTRATPWNEIPRIVYSESKKDQLYLVLQIIVSCFICCMQLPDKMQAVRKRRLEITCTITSCNTPKVLLDNYLLSNWLSTWSQLQRTCCNSRNAQPWLATRNHDSSGLSHHLPEVTYLLSIFRRRQPAGLFQNAFNDVFWHSKLWKKRHLQK